MVYQVTNLKSYFRISKRLISVVHVSYVRFHDSEM